jgi:hypothetical protein
VDGALHAALFQRLVDLQLGECGACWSQRRLPKGELQLAGSKDGGWVYTGREPEVQNGNSGLQLGKSLLEAVRANIGDPAGGLFFGHRGRRFTANLDIIF